MMPGRLAIDFGTSNTVVAVWDEVRQEGIPLHIPDYGRFYEHDNESISVVPSLIHYVDSKRRWIGAQVLEKNLYESKRTFRWMKRYIANRSPVKVRLDGIEISHSDAGKEFLSVVLDFARAELSISADEEIALTLPVESFEDYEDWLTEVAKEAGTLRFRVIDEPSAAALGYGVHIQPGDVYLVFDFGGGTLDISVVLIEEKEDTAVIGRRSRVLGKAGAEVGGMTIDQWLFQEVLQRNKLSDADEDVRKVSRALLVECERAKERLSFHERADVSVMNPDTGVVISAEFTQVEFENLLRKHELFRQINHTISRAINDARERGYDEDSIKAVLMVGGASFIPSVQRLIQDRFGRDRVMLKRPLDAVARGAAAFVAGVDFYDHIQHDYAIRYVDPERRDYAYEDIVKRGTPYPTKGPVARKTIKAHFDGSTRLGIAIFEVAERKRPSNAPVRELVFDSSGAARVVDVTPEDEKERTYFWMNKDNPTFLVADPPAKRGEPCFEVEFSIDGNKRLLITARDLRTGRITHRDYPVVKLT